MGEDWRGLQECNYVVSDPPVAYSSLSSLFKRTILSELAIGPRWPSIAHRICHTNTLVDRHVDGGRLHAILTRPPHVPLEGCTTTTAYRTPASGNGAPARFECELVLTDAAHPFIAWPTISERDNLLVNVEVKTSEKPVREDFCAFKDRHPQTAALARAVLGDHIASQLLD